MRKIRLIYHCALPLLFLVRHCAAQTQRDLPSNGREQPPVISRQEVTEIIATTRKICLRTASKLSYRSR
jgi:hypothetical protein